MTKTNKLIEDYQRTKDIRLRNKIVEENLGLVRKTAHHYSQSTHVDYEDLFQMGCIGLIKALDRFNPDFDVKLSTFVFPSIRGEITHYLRDKSTTLKIPRHLIDLEKKYQKLGKDSLTSGELQMVKEMAQNKRLTSLNIKTGVNQNDTLINLIPDENKCSQSLFLEQCLDFVDTRTRKMLVMVYLLDYTHKKTAELLGVKPVTVRRNLKKGLAAIQLKLQSSERVVG